MRWPFTKKSTGIAKKALSQPDSDLMALLTASASGSLSNATALQVPSVAAAVRIISEAVACLDIRVLRKTSNGETDDKTHPVYGLLTGDVNGWTSGAEFIRDLVAEALTRDSGAIAWVNRVNGKPAEIIHYVPGIIAVTYENSREPSFKLNGQKIDSRDIIHLRSGLGKCPLTLARDAIATAYTMAMHANQLFRNGAKPSGVIEVPGSLGDEALKKMRAGWQAGVQGSRGRADSAGWMHGRGLAYARYVHSRFPGFGAAWAAWVVDVSVQVRTGQVKIHKIVVGQDTGMVVNPDGVRHQIQGNVIQMLGRTLKERVQFDGRGVTALEWGAYPIATFADVPDIDVLQMPRQDQPPLGAGESASVPAPAAIANALFDATGRRFYRAPFTPDQVLAALQQEPAHREPAQRTARLRQAVARSG